MSNQLTRRGRRFLVSVAAALVAVPVALAAGTAPATATPARSAHWVAAWTASMQGPSTLATSGIETLSGTAQAQLLQQLASPPTAFADQTIRQVMYLHAGGNTLRVKLSNQFGTAPTTLPAVRIGKRAGSSGAAVADGTARTVTFRGARSVTIPAGGSVLSDPVALPVNAFDHVVLSMFVPHGNPPATAHGNAMQTFFTASGDQTADTRGAGYTEHGVPSGPGTNLATHLAGSLTTAAYYASGIEVAGPANGRTLVTFGDSITDGFLSSVNTDNRYPDYLARRLKADRATSCLSVANEAISGGRVTGAGIGPSALERFDAEVLGQPNVAGVVFLQGINDLGTAIVQGLPVDPQKVIEGYKTLAAKAHAAGIPIYIGTLTPAGNLARPTFYGVYSAPTAVAARHTINDWLRGAGRSYFDGIIDYDNAVKDPLVADWISTLAYDSGDNLHPNDAGYEAMAKTVPAAELAKLCR